MDFGSNALWREMLNAPILPGHAPSYELCKLLYTSHPLGAKIARMPVDMAMGEERIIRIDAALDDEPAKEFKRHWGFIGCDDIIAQLGTKARVYGAAVVVFGAVNPKTNERIPPDQDIPLHLLHELDIYFNVVDPLNTAGSITFQQDPNDPSFLKPPAAVTINGTTYKKGRFLVLMNEEPEYLDYESSAFGYSGRSSFRRCVYPLRSYLEAQIANNQVAHKAGVLIAKLKQPTSIANRAMQVFSTEKAEKLRLATNENAITIGHDEDVSTLNLMNVDNSLRGVRQHILEDIAAAATMPAQILKAETLAQGFGEGKEDAKQIAQYVTRIRRWLKSIYNYCDVVTMRRAWNPGFIAAMRDKHPKEYGTKSDETIFREWRDSFSSVFPSEQGGENAFDILEKKYHLMLDTARLLHPMVQENTAASAELLAFIQTNINNLGEDLFAGSLNIDIKAMMHNPSPPPPGGQTPPTSPGAAVPPRAGQVAAGLEKLPQD
ncbi:DUF1073 domain-containing protein [Saccharibacter sp. 17.LH.SD]|nr:DUF1073 domain-containing protein [Saccharibacter sp. 17.LH.SD]